MKIVGGSILIGVTYQMLRKSLLEARKPPMLIRRKSLLEMAEEFIDASGKIGINKTEGFTKQEIQNMYHRFQEMDTDGDGNITKHQFAELLKPVGFSDTQTSYSLFDSWDVDRNGVLSFSEILHAFSLLATNADFEQKLEMIFKAYDIDGNGAIDMDELERAIRAQSEVRGDAVPLTQEQVEVICGKFFAHFDKNRDFKISFQEFRQGYLEFEAEDFVWFSLAFDMKVEQKLATAFGVTTSV